MAEPRGTPTTTQMRSLKEAAQKIMKTNPERVYVFFNNNHAMLENARRMLQIMQTR
jgi:uncharacterized protein YecE (DUF72 family)